MVALAEIPRVVESRRTAGAVSARERWLLAALLAATLLSYLLGLDHNGWGNPFYAGTAQAGARDWTAFFFGSQDWNNVIAVDKPPLAIWPMALSVRLFGLSSWSILVPQALMGTATVWLLYTAVRRVFTARVAFAAAILCATTPVFFLMTRFNNPEPMMGLLIGFGLYFGVRAAQEPRWRWYLLMGASFGLAFLAKQFQGLLPVPALGLALLLLGAGKLKDRIVRLVGASAAMMVAAGWWVAVVELTPATARPYVGGSLTNSVVELTLNYNGLARLAQITSAGGAEAANASSGAVAYDGGVTRLFNGNFAPESGWLLTTGMISVVLLALYRRRLGGRVHILLGLASATWFVSAWLLLSFMGSMVHTYYTYSLAAPTALVVALALHALWLNPGSMIGRLYSILLIGATAYMGIRIMQYSDAWGWWGPTLLGVLALAAAGLWLNHSSRASTVLMWSITLVALAAGPVGTDVFTATTPVQGTQPLSGPISNNPNAMSRHLQDIRTTGQPDWAPHIAYGVAPSASLLALFASEGSGTGRWLAATYPAQDAAMTQLTTGRPTLALGGWLGLDPAPTLDQFKSWAAHGDIEFFVDHPAMRAYGIGRQSAAIAAWVEATYEGKKVNDAVVYRLDSAHSK
ncbi:glycosyltransferase family 39 protein [Sinomonas sp. ASV322]|uniref:glycosyltransferase family 39 protein n=1 Tax=Sinomonas sp. ASV322 TaxID=3041920 RepID=UPI0027DD931A|nr:glycosyltransferase family 39 protein [Sinomonas sp. ASV322]MDQ4501885.1 glycosyltransferase family 39 protein [Sinomonas sp. ASV322]